MHTMSPNPHSSYAAPTHMSNGVNLSEEDMMLTTCRDETKPMLAYMGNSSPIRMVQMAEADSEEPMMVTDASGMYNNTNTSIPLNLNDTPQHANPGLANLRRRLSLNLNADNFHTTNELEQSYEVTQNGTLKTKGFEIKSSGMMFYGSGGGGGLSNPLYSNGGRGTSMPYPQFGDRQTSDGQMASMAMYSTSPSPAPPLSSNQTDASPSSPNQHESIHAADLISLGSIGKGSCGTVRRALHTTTCRIVALKNINVFEKEKRHQLIKELRVLTTLNSPYLIKFHGAYYLDGVTTLVLEYMNRNSLSEMIKQSGPLNESLLQHIAIQVVKGLSVLHASKHVHRDIKPGNILINSNCDVKIADFGVLTALNATNAMATTYIGTTAFMSPERVTNDAYSASSDIWSFGVSLLYLATGHLPYSTASDNGYFGLVKAIRDLPSPTLLPTAPFSDLCRDFISKCLAKSADQRWSGPQLLAHPWLINADQEWQQQLRQTNGKCNPFTTVRYSTDLTDLEAICSAVLQQYYPVNNYRRSLFELSRFQKISSELGIAPNEVQQVFEKKYAAKFHQTAGAG